MLKQNIQLSRILWMAQKRLQSNAAAALNLEESSQQPSNSSEWELARPFQDIPKMGLMEYLWYTRPGSKYSNMDFADVMLDLRKQKGSLFRVPDMLGKSELIITDEPSDFERVFRAEGVWPERPGIDTLRHYRKDLRKDYFQGILGVTVSQAKQWGDFRSKVNPIMVQPKAVRLYYQRMSEVNKEFIQRIREIRDSKTYEVPADFEYDIKRWTLESISVVALDQQLGLMRSNSENSRAKKLMHSVGTFFQLADDLELKPSLWRKISTPKYRKCMQALDDIHEVTRSYVNEALERLKHDTKQKQDHEESVLEKLLKIDERVATVMAIDMLMAGSDSSTSAFTGILLSLAKNPAKQAKLREEVMRVLPEKDSEFTVESMKNLPYLRACIKESLRLSPVGSLNFRIVKSDIVLSGFRVPKESSVLMLISGPLTNEKYFPRADEFLPERWLREGKQSTESFGGDCPRNLKTTHAFASLPFGFGPRMCIGKRIVEMELELGLARLIRNFQVEFNHSTENAFKSLMIINMPQIPLKFKFTDVEK